MPRVFWQPGLALRSAHSGNSHRTARSRVMGSTVRGLGPTLSRHVEMRQRAVDAAGGVQYITCPIGMLIWSGNKTFNC